MFNAQFLSLAIKWYLSHLFNPTLLFNRKKKGVRVRKKEGKRGRERESGLILWTEVNKRFANIQTINTFLFTYFLYTLSLYIGLMVFLWFINPPPSNREPLDARSEAAIVLKRCIEYEFNKRLSSQFSFFC